MVTKYFLIIATFVANANTDNVGWKSYFVENPTEFHDIPLIWESKNETQVPSWLSGVYVRNGPAVVIIAFSYFHLFLSNLREITNVFRKEKKIIKCNCCTTIVVHIEKESKHQE